MRNFIVGAKQLRLYRTLVCGNKQEIDNANQYKIRCDLVYYFFNIMPTQERAPIVRPDDHSYRDVRVLNTKTKECFDIERAARHSQLLPTAVEAIRQKTSITLSQIDFPKPKEGTTETSEIKKGNLRIILTRFSHVDPS